MCNSPESSSFNRLILKLNQFTLGLVLHLRFVVVCGGGENWQLVTDESIEFEKYPVEIGDFRRLTDQFRGICRRLYLKWMKEKPEDVNM